MHERGGLQPAGKRQESATFLQCSDFDVAVQFFVCCSAAFGTNDVRTAEKRMLQCSFCSAAFRNCSATSVFACGMLQGWGLEGWGLGLADTRGPDDPCGPSSCLLGWSPWHPLLWPLTEAKPVKGFPINICLTELSWSEWGSG